MRGGWERGGVNEGRGGEGKKRVCLPLLTSFEVDTHMHIHVHVRTVHCSCTVMENVGSCNRRESVSNSIYMRVHVPRTAQTLSGKYYMYVHKVTGT